jgi:hypothetical protein
MEVPTEFGLVGVRLMHVDGRTDMTKLIGVFETVSTHLKRFY